METFWYYFPKTFLQLHFTIEQTIHCAYIQYNEVWVSYQVNL